MKKFKALLAVLGLLAGYLALQTVISYIAISAVAIPTVLEDVAKYGSFSLYDAIYNAERLLSGEYSHILLGSSNLIIALIALLIIRRRNRLGYPDSFIGNSTLLTRWSALVGGLGANVFTSIAVSVILSFSIFQSAGESYSAAESVVSSGPFAIELISVIICAPICEELIMRGLIFGRLRRDFSAASSIIITSLIFGVLHGNIVWSIYTFCIGILLGIIREKTGSLFAPILFHIGFNGMSYISVCIDISTPQRLMTALAVSAVELIFALVIIINSEKQTKNEYI